MEDDDILEIDSPLEQAVDIDDDEVDELLLEGRGAKATNTTNMKPIHYPSKAEDRSSMMLYSESLPYECESLEEFDARMDLICRRLVDCVRTKE
jgi:proteasome activator subunit 4